MVVIVNGQKRELPHEATVLDVVQLLAREDDSSPVRGVAVAVEGEVVPRGNWSSTALREDARVEVVAAIQGGAA